MSRRRGTALLAALAVLAAATPAAGQSARAGRTAQSGQSGQEPQAGQAAQEPSGSPASAETRLLRHLDTVLAAMDTLPDPDRLQTSGAMEPGTLDTFMLGGLRVVTPVEDSATVASWVGHAMDRMADRLGGVPAVPDPPTLQVDWRPITVGARLGDPWTRVWGYSPAQVRVTLESAVARALTDRLPEPVRDWISGPVGPAASPYAELVSSSTWVVGDCDSGNPVSCAVALGLEPLHRRSLSPEQAEQLEAALDARPPAQRLGGDRVAFLSPEARRSFLHYLLRTRPGALERLWTLQAPDPDVAAVLRTAADGPLEPVLAGWRDQVVADRPAPVLGAGVVGVTVAWILLFLGIATRSTRWRAR